MRIRRRFLRRCAAAAYAALLAGAALAPPRPARAEDPMAAMRAYCRADGAGARLRARTWSSIAPLVEWQIEPAWDHLYVISGYQLSTPRGTGDRVEIDVEYTVVAEILPGRIRSGSSRLDQHTFTLTREPEAETWRVLGPPSPPRLFDSVTDRRAMAALLAPENETYVSASALVWRVLEERGATISYSPVARLATSADLDDSPAGAPGDVALYYDGNRPYHAAIVESDDTVLSATLNAGVLRLPLHAFPGEIRYRVAAGARAPGTATPAAQTPSPEVAADDSVEPPRRE